MEIGGYSTIPVRLGAFSFVPSFRMAVLGGLRQPGCHTAFVPAAGFASGSAPASLAPKIISPREPKTPPGAVLEAEGQVSCPASRGLRGVWVSPAPHPLQTLGEGPLGHGDRLHSRGVMSGPGRGAGTAVSSRPAATPGLRPGAQEEREGDAHSWGTGVTLALPSPPARSPPRRTEVGGFYSKPCVPPQLSPTPSLLHRGTPRSSSGCRGAGDTSPGDMQGTNGTSSGGATNTWQSQPQLFGFYPPSQSTLAHPQASSGSRRLGTPPSLAMGVSYFPGLNVPIH